MKPLLAFALLIVPHSPVVEDRADVAELNHFFDYEGRLVFDQVIYYDWCPHHERYQVIGWRLVKGGDETYIPARNWERGGYEARWNDGDFLRSVRVKSFRETWLQYDPELAEREVLAKERRRELRRAEVR